MRRKSFHKCIKCGTNFTTLYNLENHIKNASYCKKYSNIIFTCKLCNFTTENYIEIDTHNCSKKILINDELTILKQNLKYQCELVFFYKNLLEEQFKLKIHENINGDINEILLSSVPSKIVSHILEEDVKQVEINITKKGNVFRKVNKQVDLKVEKTESELSELIQNTNLTLSKKFENLWDIDKQVIEKNMVEIIYSLKSARTYNKLLVDLKTNRLQMLKFLTFTEYKIYVEENLVNIQKIFTERGVDKNKINRLIKT